MTKLSSPALAVVLVLRILTCTHAEARPPGDAFSEEPSKVTPFARLELGPALLVGHNINAWSDNWQHGFGAVIDAAAGIRATDRLALGVGVAMSAAPRLRGNGSPFGGAACCAENQFSFATMLGPFVDLALARPEGRHGRSAFNVELAISATIFQRGAALTESAGDAAVYFGPGVALGVRYEFVSEGACSLGLSLRSAFARTSRVDNTAWLIMPALGLAGVCR